MRRQLTSYVSEFMLSWVCPALDPEPAHKIADAGSCGRKASNISHRARPLIVTETSMSQKLCKES
jgi:hypothetical protein